MAAAIVGLVAAATVVTAAMGGGSRNELQNKGDALQPKALSDYENSPERHAAAHSRHHSPHRRANAPR